MERIQVFKGGAPQDKPKEVPVDPDEAFMKEFWHRISFSIEGQSLTNFRNWFNGKMWEHDARVREKTRREMLDPKNQGGF